MIPKIENRIKKLEYNVKEYFLMKNSSQHLISLIKRFYVVSLDFDSIYLNRKNSKQFKICALIWFIIIIFSVLLICDSLYLLVDNEFLPADFK